MRLCFSVWMCRPFVCDRVKVWNPLTVALKTRPASYCSTAKNNHTPEGFPQFLFLFFFYTQLQYCIFKYAFSWEESVCKIKTKYKRNPESFFLYLYMFVCHNIFISADFWLLGYKMQKYTTVLTHIFKDYGSLYERQACTLFFKI